MIRISIPPLKRFATAEAGSITVEFVIWAPLIIAIGVGMFALSYYIATVNEVQQVAHELTRSSFALVNGGYLGEDDLCTRLFDKVLPAVVDHMALLHIDRFPAVVECPPMPDPDNIVSLSVTYDMSGSSLDSLARLLGINLGLITRTSMVQL